MKRLQMLGGLLVIPALALLISAPGCGKKDDKKPAPAPAPGPGTEAKKEGALKGGDGVIKGKVVFDGDPPKSDTIEALVKHNDCKMAPDTEKTDQTWIIGKDKGVANVVVYLKGKFESPGGEMGPVMIDQPFCQFVPRVVTMRSSQKLKVLNSAKFAHNTAWTGDPSKNPNGSETIQPGQSKELEFKAQNGPITIRCDFHKWMGGAVWVFDHPYAAVTKADGSFEIKGVPTGAEVTVSAWHEAKQNFYNQKHTFKSGDNTIDIKIGK